MFQGELQSSRIETTVSISKSYQEMFIQKVMVDKSRVIQVLINLLTNAIKFIGERSQRAINIQLSASNTQPSLAREEVSYLARRQSRSDRRVSMKDSNAEEIFLSFALKDTGRGLTEEEMKHLFKRFSQASPKTYGQYGGSGLGLFICRELVERQGGQIGLSSIVGEGTTVKFYIRARRAVDSSQTDSRTPSITTAATEPLGQFLGRQRNNSFTSTGTLSRTSSIESNNSTFDNLTPLDGFPSPKANLITEALHILIVEDNLINQRVMAQQLKQLGCITYTADNGREALSFLEKTQFYPAHLSSQQEPLIPLSCILCDLEMPVMDGLTCVRMIRTMQRDGKLNRHVPVMAVTANARNEQLDDAVEAGMVSFLIMSSRHDVS
jgi:CheY-like chemotaxis protein